MKRFALLAVLVLRGLVALAARMSGGPIVELDSGLVEGVRLEAERLRVFRGIPYAAPPVGELRWRAPQAVPAWKGVRLAREFGPPCPQSRLIAYLSGETLPATSEDCLTLNVWTPAADARARLPVLVWIHGGGFVGGWAHQRNYDGATFAARGLVFVSFHYRLGPLGYLALSELAEEEAAAAPANHGLLDQIAALRWVQRNISAFGGDPGRVTVMGESAGATSVLALCAAPAAKGLFHAAIAQSTWLTDTTFVPLAEARESARKLSEILLGEGPHSLAALRALPPDALWQELGERFQPCLAIDGRSLLEHPEEAFAAGAQHDVPLIAGTAADEGTVFLPLFPCSTVAGFRTALEQAFGAAAEEVFALYPVDDDGDVPVQLARLVTDRWFVRGTRSMLRGMSRSWQYVFTRPDPLLPALGACHAVELPFVFGQLGASATPADRELSRRMLDHWVQFAKSGDPNGAGLPPWPAFESPRESYLILGERVLLGERLRGETCDLLDGLRSDRLAAGER